MAELSKAQIQEAKRLIGGLPGTQRDAILERMSGLDVSQKKQVLSNVLSNADKFQEQSFSQKNTVRPQEFFESPASALQVTGRALQREEAAAAEPLLSFIRDVKRGPGPAFGEAQDRSPIEEFLAGAERGAKGESRSRFGERQSELGDVFRELGVPDPIAATGGLVLSSFLPSSLATAFVGRTAAKKVAQKSAAKKAASKVTSKEGPEIFQEVFRNLEKEAPATKKIGAEVIESLTNIPSDDVLFAIDNPKILTASNARPEALSDLTSKVAKSAAESIKKNPELFQVDESIFLNKSRQMMDDFKRFGDEVTQNFRQVKKQTTTRRAEGIIPKGAISRNIKLTMNRFGLSDDGVIKPIFKDNPTAKTLKNALQKLKDDFPDRPLTLEEVTDFQRSIGDIAFKRSSQAGAVGKVLPEVDAATRKLYSMNRNTIRNTFSTEPELLKAYDDFANFANIRADVRSTLKNEKKLAGLLRRLDRQNPEQLSEFREVVSALPNGVDHLDDVEKILDLKDNSLVNRLPGLTKRTPDSIEKSLETLFKKDFSSMSRIDKNTLQSLEKATGTPFTRRLVELQVARKFNSKTQFFRALAAGGILGLGFGPGAGITGALAGFAATDPRIQAQILRKGPKAVDFLKKTGQKSTPAVAPLLRRSVLEESQ